MLHSSSLGRLVRENTQAYWPFTSYKENEVLRIHSRCQSYKKILRNLRMGQIRQSVCTWQAYRAEYIVTSKVGAYLKGQPVVSLRGKFTHRFYKLERFIIVPYFHKCTKTH